MNVRIFGSMTLIASYILIAVGMPNASGPFVAGVSLLVFTVLCLNLIKE